MAAISRVGVALAALLGMLAVAGASTLVAYQGPGCTRNFKQYQGGCSNINATFRGGYSFTKTDAIAIFYFSLNCAGSAAKVIRDDIVWYCKNFTYNSVLITGPRSDGPWDITAQD